jgi:glycosyltransferase involved in cell wall biosynthesis
MKTRGLPDLVQLNVVLPAGPAALSVCKKYGLPLVVNEGWTGYDPEDGRYRGFVTKYFTKKVIAAAKAILPVTSYLSGLMQTHGLHGHYRVIPNIVDTAVFVPAPQRRRASPFRFIHVSALDDSQKNVSGIIQAFAEALKEKKGMELVVAGDGPDGSRLRELAQKLNVGGKVIFTGRVDARQLSSLFKEADALVMFSNYETFCVVIPEAMSCGLPVITSDAGGILSYLDQSTGVIVPRRDAYALRSAMLDLVAGRRVFNPEKLRAFVSERFSLEVVSSSLQQVYDSVLKQ